MKSKHFFVDNAKEIKEDHKKYETHLENTDLSSDRCTHKGGVEITRGELRCKCGASWSGPQIETLFALLNGRVI